MTLAQRVTGTAFAILAMFNVGLPLVAFGLCLHCKYIYYGVISFQFVYYYLLSLQIHLFNSRFLLRHSDRFPSKGVSGTLTSSYFADKYLGGAFIANSVFTLLIHFSLGAYFANCDAPLISTRPT